MAPRLPLLFCLLAGVGLCTPTSASPRLRCQLDQGGMSKAVEFQPVADPYGVQSVDIHGRFLFKAVMVGDERRLEYVKLYTYYRTRRKPVLLHEAKYLAPTIPAEAAATSLTGRNHLYSPHLEHEFKYDCTLFEAAP
jgi:hypothetical protein